MFIFPNFRLKNVNFLFHRVIINLLTVEFWKLLNGEMRTHGRSDSSLSPSGFRHASRLGLWIVICFADRSAELLPLSFHAAKSICVIPEDVFAHISECRVLRRKRGARVIRKLIGAIF